MAASRSAGAATVRASSGVRPATARSARLPVVGARSDLRRQLQTHQRLRLATLVTVVVVILGALPLYLMLRATTQDPVFTSLNSLQLPAWAAAGKSDTSFGSSWCILNCRFRERELTSQRSTDETAGVYQNALRSAGWQSWKVEQCPDGPADGHYSCWRRDEYTLDLWVRDPPCKTDPLQQRATAAPPASPGKAAGAGAGPGACGGSVISIKVRDRIDDQRGRGPEPTVDKSLTGETPDAVLTGIPITPSPTG